MAFCENLLEFLKKRGYLLMTIFLIIQTALSILFTIIFFILQLETHNSIRIKVFVSLILALFLCFMFYFAYHSVKYFFLTDLDESSKCS